MEKSYFEKNVNTPFDYIVLDHQQLDSKLMTHGIDTHVFWNIWRLTPSVYRFRTDYEFTGDWLVKRELKKEADATEENAIYVLEQTLDIALHLVKRRRLLRSTGDGQFYIRLKRDGVSIYAKADRNSAVNMVTEPALRQVDVQYSTIGLNDDGTYWCVLHIVGPNLNTGVRFYHGFVHEDDVDWSVPETPPLPLPVADGIKGTIEHQPDTDNLADSANPEAEPISGWMASPEPLADMDVEDA